MSGEVKTPEERLLERGIELPIPPPPVALYQAFVISGPWLWISGQLPLEAGTVRYAGKVGSDIEVDEGTEAARLCALNGLAQARKALGTLDRVVRCVQAVVYVNSSPGFIQQPVVANGASNCLAEILGDRAGHSRVAVGVAELPLNAAVEISLVLEIS